MRYYKKTQLFLILIIIYGFFSRSNVIADEDTVTQQIKEAEININAAYKLLNKLPENVSLVQDMNIVVSHLMDAKEALIIGDIDYAESKSSIALELSRALLIEANNFYIKSIAQKNQDLQSQDMYSGIFILIVIISGYLIWIYIEKIHYKEILSKRPEIIR